MAGSRYQIYLFGSDDYETKSPSQAISFEIYFNNKKLVASGEFPKSWKNVKKKAAIEKAIAEAERKRLLKLFRKKAPRKFRQTTLSLEENFDYKLLDRSGKIIGPGQFSKAHGFKLYKRDNYTNRFKLASAWSFSHPSISSSEKKKQITEATLEKEIISVLPPEIDLDEIEEPDFTPVEEVEEIKVEELLDHKVTLSKSQGFMAYKTDPAFSKFRKITFLDPMPVEVVMEEMTPRQKDDLKEVFEKEWAKEWNRSQNSEYKFNMRVMFQYYDRHGELMTVMDEDGNLTPLIQGANTSRWSIDSYESGIILFNDLIDAIEDSFAGYLNANNGNIGVISSFMFESLYRN